MVYSPVEGGTFILEPLLGYCNGGDKWLYPGYDYTTTPLTSDLLRVKQNYLHII